MQCSCELGENAVVEGYELPFRCSWANKSVSEFASRDFRYNRCVLERFQNRDRQSRFYSQSGSLSFIQEVIRNTQAGARKPKTGNPLRHSPGIEPSKVLSHLRSGYLEPCHETNYGSPTRRRLHALSDISLRKKLGVIDCNCESSELR